MTAPKKPVHHFHKSLAAGKAGEQALLLLWPELQPTDGKAGDFTLPDGKLVELKTDSYDHDKTSNLFIERYSCLEKGTPGGPWQAKKHNCHYFAYFFPKNGICYVYEVDALLKRLEEINLGKPVEIANIRWTTLGFKVARSLLSPDRVLRAPKKQS